MTQELLEQIAHYYIESNKDGFVSIDEVSIKYNVSKSSVVRYFNRACNIKLPSYLQQQVNLIKEKNWIRGKSTSGNQDKKKLSNADIIKAARIYITGDFTLKEISSKFGVSPATLYNNFKEEILGNELYLKIIEIYNQNKSKNKGVI